ncbi:MAG: hypothetical protein JWR26_610 [Pedosphaera sp.]|nr:hypothetical protein [Pedosphaera sp.]
MKTGKFNRIERKEHIGNLKRTGACARPPDLQDEDGTFNRSFHGLRPPPRIKTEFARSFAGEQLGNLPRDAGLGRGCLPRSSLPPKRGGGEGEDLEFLIGFAGIVEPCRSRGSFYGLRLSHSMKTKITGLATKQQRSELSRKDWTWMGRGAGLDRGWQKLSATSPRTPHHTTLFLEEMVLAGGQPETRAPSCCKQTKKGTRVI